VKSDKGKDKEKEKEATRIRVEKETPRIRVEEEEEEEEEDDEEETLEGHRESGTAIPSREVSKPTGGTKKSHYVSGTLNKCGNASCDKREPSENQFKLCSRCKKSVLLHH